jgi:hypothetical protein
MNRTKKCAVACVLLLTQIAVSQPAPLYFGTLHELLVKTIQSDLPVDAVMTGEIAQSMNKQFKMTGAVNVRSEIVKRHRNPDCAKLRVVFTKRGVLTPKGVTDANLRTEMNYCLDGSPPGDKDL